MPTTHENQFGGSISGKIIKDKLFFFGDAQLTRRLLGGSLLTSVPVSSESEREFQRLACSQPKQRHLRSKYWRTKRPALDVLLSRITPSRQASSARKRRRFFSIFRCRIPSEAVVNGVAAPYNNYENSGTLNVNGNQWNTRFDYVANEKNTFFGRYSYATFTEQAPGVFGIEAGGQAFNNANYAGNSSAFNESIAAGWTHTVNPTLINEFRFGYMRYHVTDVPNGYGTQPATAAGHSGNESRYDLYLRSSVFRD